MSKKMIVPCLRVAGFAVLFMLHSAHVSAQVPAEAEARLRGIYERGELDARSFREPWLPDGSGYTALEAPAGANERELVTYDAASGQRTVLVSLAQLIPPGGTEPLAIESYTFSPDESWLLLQTSRNDLEGRVDEYWKLERASGTLRRAGRTAFLPTASASFTLSRGICTSTICAVIGRLPSRRPASLARFRTVVRPGVPMESGSPS